MSFRDRYGPWGLVAGASVGLGAAFAEGLAARGLNVVLLSRRQDALDELAASLRARHGVEARTIASDLGSADLAPRVAAATADLEVGCLVYNAAHSVVGPFLDRPLEEQLRVVDVNCRGPLALAHLLGGPMARRGRGGIVLMTSIAGSQGGAWLASYAASKAFNLVLAEGLWDELRERGVDVVACRAGAILTPGYAASKPQRSVPAMRPPPVAEAALRALGRGPSVVPGWLNKLTVFLFDRLFPRRLSIQVMGSATRRLYGEPS